LHKRVRGVVYDGTYDVYVVRRENVTGSLLYRPWWGEVVGSGKQVTVYHTSPLQEGFETGMLTRICAMTCSEDSEVGGTARPIATR
jgi:hypothetical protein